MLKVGYEVTADQPCQIPVIGEFEAGETREVTADQEMHFERILGYKLQTGAWPTWVHLTTVLTEKED
jgi:hypothetical protein